MPKVGNSVSNKVQKESTKKKILTGESVGPKKVGEMLGISRQQVMKYIASGAIKARREENIFSPTGKGWLIDVEDVEAFKKSYVSPQETGGFTKGLRKKREKDLTKQKQHPLTILQRKLKRAVKATEEFQAALSNQFPERAKKTKTQFKSALDSLQAYLSVTAPTTPHIDPTTLES